MWFGAAVKGVIQFYSHNVKMDIGENLMNSYVTRSGCRAEIYSLITIKKVECLMWKITSSILPEPLCRPISNSITGTFTAQTYRE